ncbi:MAG: hypothetical protein ACKPKO_41275 [Candidatus Fonsibacter sp.]
MAERIDAAGTPAHIFYFVRCVESLAAFDLIDHYIRTNKSVWKRIATHNRVKDMFRNLDVSAHETNGGPPPPPPPPRGSPPIPSPG